MHRSHKVTAPIVDILVSWGTLSDPIYMPLSCWISNSRWLWKQCNLKYSILSQILTKCLSQKLTWSIYATHIGHAPPIAWNTVVFEYSIGNLLWQSCLTPHDCKIVVWPHATCHTCFQYLIYIYQWSMKLASHCLTYVGVSTHFILYHSVLHCGLVLCTWVMLCLHAMPPFFFLKPFNP